MTDITPEQVNLENLTAAIRELQRMFADKNVKPNAWDGTDRREQKPRKKKDLWRRIRTEDGDWWREKFFAILAAAATAVGTVTLIVVLTGKDSISSNSTKIGENTRSIGIQAAVIAQMDVMAQQGRTAVMDELKRLSRRFEEFGSQQASMNQIINSLVKTTDERHADISERVLRLERGGK